MRRGMRITVVMLAVAAIAATMTGCIYAPWWWYENYPPRRAILHVYVSDYYTGAPISWASVDLYESDWWSWDYIGTWPVGPSGHVTLDGGYLYFDGDGGPEEEDFRVTVYASGYETLTYTLELDYHRPSETLYFYLVPFPMREGVEAETTKEAQASQERPAEIPRDAAADESRNRELVGEKVFIGEPREVKQ